MDAVFEQRQAALMVSMVGWSSHRPADRAFEFVVLKREANQSADSRARFGNVLLTQLGLATGGHRAELCYRQYGVEQQWSCGQFR